jgi:hypothetical protein
MTDQIQELNTKVCSHSLLSSTNLFCSILPDYRKFSGL